ncbi:MAG TPA: STAS domain-containing protein [Candidatus Nitrosotalea sp.]|nr:STAS domain-containing protein [Candidatus Nitrosotalea sp.]
MHDPIPHNGQVEAKAFVIQLEGEFDLSERERLTDAFSVPRSAPAVVVDLKRTTYIDSTVLSCLVSLDMATKERGGRLFIVGASPAISRILAITSLDKRLNVLASLSDLSNLDLAQARRLTLVAQS